ncbi:hypothetical protein PGT21_011650 [Puccinia graminis f. sp. tritici]|uniref:Uncharacterized protein n=1 Tax=Puccinia graminis f. sp. tritici TaxID=56615 RepID=A0A5B0MH29_PUCGR|nr:hypothetical protein PGT21_011650 [Puccinia graminis f. sp. tritici]KAA1126721.1 hypothetical protein PGTUg99_008863 [Puccinia graminis f. sp. tritici]
MGQCINPLQQSNLNRLELHQPVPCTFTSIHESSPLLSVETFLIRPVSRAKCAQRGGKTHSDCYLRTSSAEIVFHLSIESASIAKHDCVE